MQGIVNSRISRNVAVQDAEIPYIVYAVIDDVAMMHLTAQSGDAIARVQVDSYADSHDGARELADAVREAVNGFYGTVTTSEGSIDITMLKLDTSYDSYETPSGGGE